jgi:hypothetical protein
MNLWSIDEMYEYGRRVNAVCFGLLLVATLSGCGGDTGEGAADREDTYPASGVVLYNGQPVEGASVVFECLEQGKPGATGITDAEGRFTLTTFKPGDGAVTGRFIAKVSKTTLEGEDLSYSDINSPNYGKVPPPEALGKTKHHVPEKYGSFDSAGLGAEITTEGNTAIKFELTGG